MRSKSVRMAVLSFLFGVLWLSELITTLSGLLILSIVAYALAPVFGVQPLSLGQLVVAVASNPDHWLTLIGLLVAFFAVQGFLDSKRLDMRIAAADAVQELSKEFGQIATKRAMAAESLKEFREFALAHPIAKLQCSDRDAADKLLRSVQATLPAVLENKLAMHSVVFSVLDVERRHRLAIQSSSIATLALESAQKRIVELAGIDFAFFPTPPFDLDSLYQWTDSPLSLQSEAYIEASNKLVGRIHGSIGGCAGALGGTVFKRSIAAYWTSMRGWLLD